MVMKRIGNAWERCLDTISHQLSIFRIRILGDYSGYTSIYGIQSTIVVSVFVRIDFLNYEPENLSI